MPLCDDEHDFEFLRQEKINIGFDRNPTWKYEDVFFCKRCLTYQRVTVKHTRPASEYFGEVEVYVP